PRMCVSDIMLVCGFGCFSFTNYNRKYNIYIMRERHMHVLDSLCFQYIIRSTMKMKKRSAWRGKGLASGKWTCVDTSMDMHMFLDGYLSMYMCVYVVRYIRACK